MNKKQLLQKRNILWDFDGVILDSMDVREEGFEKVLSVYPEQEVSELIKFHRKNGGLSRYVKFRYFLEDVRKESEKVEEKVQVLATSYSEIMRTRLISQDRLIGEVLSFIKTNFKNYRMHLVSGSDGDELRFLCDKLNIAGYFQSINGSPTPKTEFVQKTIAENEYHLEETCLIGDSINDFDSADQNQIDFFGFNNTELKNKGAGYLSSFSTI